jgi:hypothetical protein
LNEKLASSFSRAIKNGATKQNLLYTKLLKTLQLAHNG